MRVINARAPVRICDLGGWTDTWFGGPGRVCNIAVVPFVDVQLVVHDGRRRDHQVLLDVADFDDQYGFDVDDRPGRHPLLEETVAELLPPGTAVDVTLRSGVPPGCGTGTSAAVTVALVAALDGLTHGRSGPAAVARTAHRIETDRLGLESGVQDQVAAAHGGISAISVTEFPTADVAPVRVATKVPWELERRLLLVYLGAAHRSSDVHRQVIDRLVAEGGTAGELDALRQAAVRGERALRSGDLEELGRAMLDNSAAQAALHPGLIGGRARRVAEVAEAHGAIGWKVNGAGGEGGSMTVLCGPLAADRRRLERAVADIEGCRVIPVALSPRGVQRWSLRL